MLVGCNADWPFDPLGQGQHSPRQTPRFYEELEEGIEGVLYMGKAPKEAHPLEEEGEVAGIGRKEETRLI
jgi:hypothetical protein